MVLWHFDLGDGVSPDSKKIRFTSELMKIQFRFTNHILNWRDCQVESSGTASHFPSGDKKIYELHISIYFPTKSPVLRYRFFLYLIMLSFLAVGVKCIENRYIGVKKLLGSSLYY